MISFSSCRNIVAKTLEIMVAKKEIKDPKYVIPTSDIGFHWVFCKEGNEDLVIQLLNACIDEKEIVSFEWLNPEHTVNADTSFRFDLYCKCTDGSRIIVECQNMTKREHFLKRAMAYTSMAITDQLRPGLKYNYSKVYFVGLLTYNQFKNREQAVTKVRLYTEGDYLLVEEDYLQIFIELRKLPEKTDGDFSNLFLRAVRDLGKDIGETPQEFNDKRLDKLKIASDFGSMPSDKQEDYRGFMTTEEDIRGFIEEQIADGIEEGIQARLKEISEQGLEQGLQQGLQQGIEQGLQQGIEKGLQQGIEQGLQQGLQQGIQQGKLDIARAMKTEGLDESMIVKLTGLGIEQVRSL